MAWLNSISERVFEDYYNLRQERQRIRDAYECYRSNVAEINAPLNSFKTSKVTTIPINRSLWNYDYVTAENMIELKSADDLIEMLDIKIRNEFGGVKSEYNKYEMIKCIGKLDKIKTELLKKLNNAI